MTTQQFHQWLRTADPLDRTVYHEGYLAKDRMWNLPLSALADLVLTACEEGFVVLTQRRHSLDHYSYIAIRTAEISG